MTLSPPGPPASPHDRAGIAPPGPGPKAGQEPAGKAGPLVQYALLGDASTLFNTWQRIAGSFGIGLVAALYAAQARAGGPVAALHTAGLVLVGVAAAGALGALALPALRNTALEY